MFFALTNVNHSYASITFCLCAAVYKAYKNSVALQQIIDLSVNASHDY